MGERAAGDVGEDLLHDRVVPVLGLGLDHLDRGVGEDRVVAPGGEQLALPSAAFSFWSRTRRTISRAADRLVLVVLERGVAGLGDLGVGDPAAAAGRPISRAGT